MTISLNVKNVKHNVKIVYAYSELTNKLKRSLRKGLSDGNSCMLEIFDKILVDDEAMNHYATAFSFVPEEVFLTWLVNIEGPREFNDTIMTHLEDIAILKELDKGQLVFLQQLLYNLGLIICKHALTSSDPTTAKKRRVIRSPPPRGRR
jgi:hypothetical protein|tara:strand:- start:90 stop:536 length:447 start_codon:yes stop_codon:yes gene_type:complete